MAMTTSLFAERFAFKYNAGDSYRILSTVQEDVYFNGLFNHHAEIVNRIAVSIVEVDENGSARHDATFMTSEASTTRDGKPLFTWGEEYPSNFLRSTQGVYTISDEYFMPVVRNVPVFPDRDIKVGETWTANGEEAHDLRRGFDMQTPFKIPFVVQYQYIGPVQKDGKTLHKISAQYTMSFTNTKRPVDRLADYPYNTLGYSNQTIYWDNEAGAIHSYEEKFRIAIDTAYGTSVLFEGTAQAEVSDYVSSQPAVSADELQKQIDELGIANAQVTETDKGINISIENIQFKSDSAVLQESEKIKLQKIAKLLEAYPDNDLLVSGHTALAGTAQARQLLSEERAQAVASYLIELGVRDAYHIFSRGYGAEQPIAPNTTPEGMARNRRVEITILK